VNGLARALCALATVVAVAALGNTASLADTAPQVPVTFSGTLVAGETQSFHFTVPDSELYRATVSPANAPLTLTLTGQYPQQPPIKNWQSGGLWPLVDYTLDVHSDVATPFEVTVEEIPPKLANVSGGGIQYAGPNGSFTATYTLDVPAYVEPVITSWDYHDGLVVPVNYMKSPGDETFTWNLRDADGKRLPDGWYSVALRARNSTATSLAVPAGEVIIDSTPPAIDLQLDGPPDSHAGVLLDIMDPGPHPPSLPHPYGIASVRASVDGRSSKAMAWTGPSLWNWASATPPDGAWSPGRHTVTVTAIDDAGNGGSSSISFTVPGPTGDTAPPANVVAAPVIAGAPQPDCSTAAIKSAIRPFTHRFKLAQHECSDLTGDDASELVVLLRAKRGPKTVAAIYRQAGAAWALAYRDIRHRIRRIGRVSHDLRETLRDGRKIRVHWSGSRFLATGA